MQIMFVKFVKLDKEAVVPSKAKEGDAGFDLVALDDGVIDEDGYIQYKTGLAIEPPLGYHTEIFPRSSISKKDLVLANSIGLVDNGYRGEILVRFKAVDSLERQSTGDVRSLSKDNLRLYSKGDKIAQLVIRQTIQVSFIEVEELSDSSRGSGGFGSSGR